jgi:hypothetical protein
VKTLLIYPFFYYYSLIDPETKYKPEASATPILPKPDNTKASASSAIKQSPTTMKGTPKDTTKSSTLTQNHS